MQMHADHDRLMRKVLPPMGATVVLLAGVILVRTATHGTPESALEPVQAVAVPDGAAERLAGLLRIRTISHEDPASFDGDAFRAVHAYLDEAFPRVHAQLRRETVAAHSLLYTWQGRDPSADGILLMGHLDVVPVEAETEANWQEHPFSGRIADGYIWGRGAIDNKSAVAGTLEAVEMLLAEGFRPRRTVYLAFGHDEEVGGSGGARQISGLLRRRGVRLEMVLDEGGVIGEGLFPGVSAPLAMVGVAEKGFLSVELSIRMPGGHSSLPPRQGAVGIVSAAVAQLEANPMPARLEGATRQLFDRIGPQVPFGQRAVFANLWLTRPLVMRKLEGSPTTNAMIRTTTAATIFQAGSKDNVLPSHARAVVNFRILPGDSIAAVLEHVRQVVDDRRIEIKTVGRFSAEPSKPSSTQSDSYRRLEGAIRKLNPGAIVAPYLVVVVTDARYFADLSANVFRFLPVRLAPSDLARMHGTDERIAVRDYEAAIRTYRQLFLDAT
jgi:carboxypeptidase PM20D1